MIKQEYVKVPAVPVTPYPPPGHLTAHDIRFGDQTWGSLQALYGRESAWDIIQYNFNTVDPKEVNWYLGNPAYVGCVRTTGDKKNFRFSAKANPGILYIPPVSWKPGHPPVPPPVPWEKQQDAAAKATVLRILKGSGVKPVNFTWGSVTVDQAALRRVADLVETGRIAVAWDEALPMTRAAYDSDGNSFFISNVHASTDFYEALIVHEAAHAVLDMRGKPMSVMESEGVGYLAQAMFYLEKTGMTLTGSPALRTASEIADRLLYQNQTLDLVARGALMTAVFMTPLYRNDRFGSANYNGIP